MGNLSEILELLERASELNKQRQFREMAQLLENVPRNDLLTELELAYLQARAWQIIGRADAALRSVREVGVLCRIRNNEALYRRCRNLEGVLLVDVGRLAEAEILFHQLGADAVAAHDIMLIAHVNNNLGVIATLHGRWSAALAAYGRAASAYSQAGDQSMLTLSHHNLAMAYRELGHLAKADKHFSLALGFAGRHASEEELTIICFERALLMSMRGDHTMATKTAQGALNRACRLGNLWLQAEALRVLGMILVNRECWEDAQSYLERALRITGEIPARLLEAEVREALAWLEYKVGKSDAAMEHANSAMRLYTTMGSTYRASRVVRRLQTADLNQRAV